MFACACVHLPVLIATWVCLRVIEWLTGWVQVCPAASSIIYINNRFIKCPKRRLGSEMRGGVCAAGPSILLAGDKTRRSGRRVTERAPRGNRESLMRERESDRERERKRERDSSSSSSKTRSLTRLESSPAEERWASSRGNDHRPSAARLAALRPLLPDPVRSSDPLPLR